MLHLLYIRGTLTELFEASHPSCIWNKTNQELVEKLLMATVMDSGGIVNFLKHRLSGRNEHRNYSLQTKPTYGIQ